MINYSEKLDISLFKLFTKIYLSNPITINFVVISKNTIKRPLININTALSNKLDIYFLKYNNQCLTNNQKLSLKYIFYLSSIKLPTNKNTT